MRKFVFIICILMCTTTSFAQEIGKFRGGLEGGYIPFWDIMSFSGTAELKYNVQNNMNVGFRTAFATIRTCKCNSSELLSFSFTYDYYFHYSNTLFSPFVGAGVGYYFSGGREHGGEDEEGIYRKKNNPTCFARVGLEVWKIRVAFDYNLIRNSKGFNGSKNLDYMSVMLGFYIGGGKWKKKLEL